MKAMNSQDDIPSIPIDNFKDHYVLVFDLISMQNATEKFHYPESVGEIRSLELNFTYLLEYVSELIVLGEWMSSVADEKFDVFGKNNQNGRSFSPANNQSYPATQVPVPWLISL